ncbi:MAG: FAD-binding oxidoreductase [Tissierellia bacterium]|nr:FAD-binding oxidoreductase [Tissierellia bacterium]
MDVKFNKVTPEIVEAIKKAVDCKVYVGEEINPDFFHDEMPIYGSGKPEVVVAVTSTEEVSAVMKICNENLIPVIARGAGSGIVGAAVAIHGGVMLDMTAFNKILHYDLENFVVTVQPGVLLDDLDKDCRTRGFFYPPDPGQRLATLGGNVATNAGGMRAVKYGTTRDYVRMMKVVLADGQIMEFGANVKKSTTGFDLKSLVIGSEGTLAIMTELTLKILPVPTEDISILVPFANLKEAVAAVPVLFRQHINPQSCEFMTLDMVKFTEKYLGKETFPHSVDGVEAKAYLLIRFDGNDQDELYALAERTFEVLMENKALDAYLADTPEKKEQAWLARASMYEALVQQYKTLDECDVVVPISKISEFIDVVDESAKKYDFYVQYVGHAGDGNIHVFGVTNDMDIEVFKQQMDEWMHTLYSKAYEFGGSLSGEHGTGHGKIEYLEKYEGTPKIELMRRVKKAFDPNGILNPGKVI